MTMQFSSYQLLQTPLADMKRRGRDEFKKKGVLPEGGFLWINFRFWIY